MGYHLIEYFVKKKKVQLSLPFVNNELPNDRFNEHLEHA